MAKRRTKPAAGHRPKHVDRRSSSSIRIIGGQFRGRLLAYHGDPRTRPMKDRTREAIFNLLGPAIKGMHAVDLFAGTGALGLEALSRGADKATFIERHVPTAKLIEQNTLTLGVEDRAQVHYADAFHWVRQGGYEFPLPWAVFCSPPYDFYVDRRTEMLELIQTLVERMPANSVFVVESDERFTPELLPQPDLWDTRRYRPAVVHIRWRS